MILVGKTRRTWGLIFTRRLTSMHCQKAEWFSRTPISCAANCAPARACLLSGQYTPRHQMYNVGTRPRGKSQHRRLEHIPGVDTLDPQIKTWAHQLQAAGYKTATMGKWHLSDDPLPYGFDLNVGGTHSGSPPRGYYPPHNKILSLANAPDDEYLTDRLSAESCKFIEANKDHPWMLYLTHFRCSYAAPSQKRIASEVRIERAGKTPRSCRDGDHDPIRR